MGKYNFSATRLLVNEKEAPNRDIILLHLPRTVLEQMLTQVREDEVLSITIEGRLTDL